MELVYWHHSATPRIIRTNAFFLDALRVKIRDAESRHVKNKVVYVALGVTPGANARFSVIASNHLPVRVAARNQFAILGPERFNR